MSVQIPADRPGERGPDDFPVVEGYDVIDVVGRGGMGAVYEAIQRSTGRRVAIKVMLERVAQTEAARRRFEREVELIARLQHPNIVHVLDSGVDRGRYFYVMEFVEGVALDDFCKAGTCDVRATLAIMAKVARAVDYAHQRGVMHRDLKPSNIVVDERGEPHLLDFGLAKAFDPHSLVAMRDSLSEPGQVIGTLGYMAPEQARGAVDQVSVRSDIYALGAIAYELIAGQLPCPIDGAMALVFTRIESRDPDRPSSLREGVAADVDAVLLKCLEKSPAKRYATAGLLADDIERWLSDRPVSARRASAAERAARWCRRNPAWAGLAMTAAALLVVFAGSAWWTSRLERQRQQAERYQKDDFETMGRTLLEFDPDRNPGLAEAAAITLAQVEAGLDATPRPPEEEASRREMIADKQRKIGQYASAERNARRVVELREQMPRTTPADLARALRNLGASLYDLRRFEEAEPVYRRALQIRTSLHKGADHEDVADSMNHLAMTLAQLGRFEEAEPMQRDAVAMRSRMHGDADERSAAAVNNLATVMMLKGDWPQAESLYRDAMDRFRKVRGEKHRYVGRSLRNIAACVAAQGRLDDADRLLADSLRITSEVLGAESIEAANTLRDTAELRLMQRRSAEAEALARKTLGIRATRLGLQNLDTVDAQVLVARALLAQGRWPEALVELGDGRSLGVAIAPGRSDEASEAALFRAVALVGVGRAEEGAQVAQEAARLLRDASAGAVERRARLIHEAEQDLALLPESPGTSRVIEIVRSSLDRAASGDGASGAR